MINQAKEARAEENLQAVAERAPTLHVLIHRVVNDHLVETPRNHSSPRGEIQNHFQSQHVEESRMADPKTSHPINPRAKATSENVLKAQDFHPEVKNHFHAHAMTVTTQNALPDFLTKATQKTFQNHADHTIAKTIHPRDLHEVTNLMVVLKMIQVRDHHAEAISKDVQKADTLPVKKSRLNVPARIVMIQNVHPDFLIKRTLIKKTQSVRPVMNHCGLSFLTRKNVARKRVSSLS